MIDLRKTSMEKIAVNIKPRDSKERDFHLALADYLYKELKSEGLSVSRRNVIIKVALENAYLDKYEHVIVDCLDGKMYLRGKEVRDRYFGKLRRFEGQRPSDAYHCVVQSATRIINRIKSLFKTLDDEEREVFGEIENEPIKYIDLRRKSQEKMLNQREIDEIVKKLKNGEITDLRNKNKTASVERKDLRKTGQLNQSITITDLRKPLRKDLRKTAEIIRIDMRKKKDSLLNSILEHNKNFTKSENLEDVTAHARTDVLVFTCIDPRLVDLVEASMGFKRGDIKVVKNAGNTITEDNGDVIRTLCVATTEMDVNEIYVVGHKDCGMHKLDVDKLKQDMQDEGLPKIKDLRHWSGKINDEIENIKNTVQKIKNSAYIHKGVLVHGLLIDPNSGKLDIVVNDELGVEKNEKTD